MTNHALNALIPAYFWIVGNATRFARLDNHSKNIASVEKNAPLFLDVDYVHKMATAISASQDILDPQIVNTRTIYHQTSLCSLSSLLLLWRLAYQFMNVQSMDSVGLVAYAISCLQQLNSLAWSF